MERGDTKKQSDSLEAFIHMQMPSALYCRTHLALIASRRAFHDAPRLMLREPSPPKNQLTQDQ